MRSLRIVVHPGLLLLAAVLVGSCGNGSHGAEPPASVNPSADPSSRFGSEVRVLANGNVVVTDPVLTVGGHTKAGAVYLYDGRTGALISTLSGSASNEAVGGGGVGVLANGNFLVFSNYGAYDSTHPGVGTTFVNGTTGLDGTVSDANTLLQGYLGSEVHEDATFGPCIANGRPEMARAAANVVVAFTKP